MVDSPHSPLPGERPGSFSKVISHIGSFTRLRGGSEYPYRIRLTRGDPKPIRVFLQDGSNGLNLLQGNWTLGNLAMESALMYARYDYRFEMGTGGHDLAHAGTIFLIPCDGSGVTILASSVPLETSRHFIIVGEWHVVTNILAPSTTLSSPSASAMANCMQRLSMKPMARSTCAQLPSKTAFYATSTRDHRHNSAGRRDSTEEIETWLKVHDDSLTGALSGDINSEIDFSVTGRRAAGRSGRKNRERIKTSAPNGPR